MNAFKHLILFIANLNFGKNYFSLTSLCLLLLSTLFLVLAIFFKSLRRINKSVMIGVISCAYLVCIIKLLCQIYAFLAVDYAQLILCSFFALIQVVVIVIFCLLKPVKTDFIIDNGIIGGLFDNNRKYCHYDYGGDFASNPFKKIERLPTKKMFETDSQGDFNLNFPYLLKRIELLDFTALSPVEQNDVFNLKSMVENLSHREITDKDREMLCDGISKFLKISARYDEFLPDKF